MGQGRNSTRPAQNRSKRPLLITLAASALSVPSAPRPGPPLRAAAAGPLRTAAAACEGAGDPPGRRQAPTAPSEAAAHNPQDPHPQAPRPPSAEARSRRTAAAAAGAAGSAAAAAGAAGRRSPGGGPATRGRSRRGPAGREGGPGAAAWGRRGAGQRAARRRRRPSPGVVPPGPQTAWGGLGGPQARQALASAAPVAVGPAQAAAASDPSCRRNRSLPLDQGARRRRGPRRRGWGAGSGARPRDRGSPRGRRR
jgi:hypothetical protein